MTLDQIRMFGLAMIRTQHGYLRKLAQVIHIASQGKSKDVDKLIKALEVRDPEDLKQQEADRMELWKEYQTGFATFGSD